MSKVLRLVATSTSPHILTATRPLTQRLRYPPSPPPPAQLLMPFCPLIPRRTHSFTNLRPLGTHSGVVVCTASVLRPGVLHYNLEGREIYSRWGYWNFSLTLSFGLYYGHGVDSTSNRKTYQGYLLADKGSRCVELTTLPSSCSDCLEILGSSTSWSCKGLYMPVLG